MEDLIRDLSGKDPRQRLVEQEFFLKNSAASNEKIKTLKEKTQELESQQKQKIAEVLKFRMARQGMEKLREEAKEQYIKEQEELEQKELDEEAGILFVRSS